METRHHFVESLRNELIAFPLDSASLDPVVSAESFSSCNRFEKLLDQYASDDSILTNDFLEKVFKRFLAERWQGIHGIRKNEIEGTNAIYTVLPSTRINKICYQLAEMLSVRLKEPVHELLMPHLKSKKYQSLSKELSEARLQGYIFGDRGDPVFILACLDNFFDKKNLHHTCHHLSGVVLTENEKKRVIYYSNASANYYDAMSSHFGNEMTDEIKTARKKLEDLLKQSEYQHQFIPHYPEASQKRLMAYLCSHLQVQNDLPSLICEAIPLRQHWQSFIRIISTQDLFRLIFNMENVSDEKIPSVYDLKASALTLFNIVFFKLNNRKPEAKNPKLSTRQIAGMRKTKENMVRAFLACLLEACRRSREAEGNYRSYAGYYIGAFFQSVSGAYSKEQKLDALDAFAAFFTDPNRQLAEYRNFLNEMALTEHWGPLNSGFLCWIKDQILKIAIHFEEQQPSVMSSSRK